jgi:hypothetical protein
VRVLYSLLDIVFQNENVEKTERPALMQLYHVKLYFTHDGA